MVNSSPEIYNPKTKKWDGQFSGKLEYGQIRRLPKSNSPLWSRQWAVQGSAKSPYIVSRKTESAGTVISWSCSCPSWTKYSPRVDCKHCVEVKKVEGILVDTSLGIPVMDTKTARAFAEFQKQKKKPAESTGQPAPLFTQGRKFRA